MKVHIKILLFGLLLSLIGGSACNWFAPKCKCPAPASVTSSNITNVSATLSWTPAPGVTNYRVQVSKVAPGGTPTLVIDTIVGGVTFTATNLTPATGYEAKVFSICKCGMSETPATTSFRTSADGIIVDDIIAQVKLEKLMQTSTAGNLNWGTGTGTEYIEALGSNGKRAVFQRKYLNNDWELRAGTQDPTLTVDNSNGTVTWAYNNNGTTVSIIFMVTETAVSIQSVSNGYTLRRFQE